MRKKISLFLALLMAVTAIGCSKGNETNQDTSADSSKKQEEVVTDGGQAAETLDENEDGLEINKVQVTFAKESEERLEVEAKAAEAVNTYLAARFYLDKFLQYDINSGNATEYGELLQNTVDAFAAVEKVSEDLSVEAAALEELEADASYSGADGSGEYKEVAFVESSSAGEGENIFDCASFVETLASLELNPFQVNAYAEEESEAVRWARDITERFDKAPAGKGLKTLADQMGTDAKHAYAQLKQAQDILSGDAYGNFADTANACYKTAMVLKTAGTAAQLTLSVVTANPATVTEAVITGGGIIVNGLNTVLEVGQTGSVLMVGDDNKLSQTLENMESALAPIGAAVGLYGFSSNILKGKELLDDTPALADSLMYIGSSLNDYLSDGKILGGSWTQNDDGTISCTLSDTMTIKTAWEKSEAAQEEILTAAGYSPEEIQSTLGADENTTAAAPDTVNEILLENIEGYIENISETVPEMAGINAEEIFAQTDLPETVTVVSDSDNADEVEPADSKDSGSEDDSAAAKDNGETDDGSADDLKDAEDSEQESKFPSIGEICGSYSIAAHLTMGDQEADGTLIYTFSDAGGNTLSMTDESGLALTASYDEATGKATFYDTDGTPIKTSFSRTDNGGVKVNFSYSADNATMNGSGVK